MTNAQSLILALQLRPGWDKSAIIKQEGNAFILYSHHGKVLGRHPSREKAVKQEQAIKANGG